LSVVRQLAQAALTLSLLGWVTWLLQAALRDHHRPDRCEQVGGHLMWTAIWTLAVFVLALFLGELILTFAGEQLRERRAHRLAVERERTKQAIVAQQRDELIWRQLQGPAQPSSTTPADHT
jgi:heme A synthase